MSTPNFKTHIKQIRKEALELGFSISTMDGYLKIWNKFIIWENNDNFIYLEEEYSKFLLDYYNFDVNTYSNKSKSRDQQLMRSKRILDDFDSYKSFMIKRSLPNALYDNYPTSWNSTLDNYLDYCKDVRNNAQSSIKLKKDYLIRLLSYFYQNKINDLSKLNSSIITLFINHVIDKGSISKRRNFHVLKDFLEYLFIEGILKEDYSYLIPKMRKQGKKRIPTYLKQNEVEKLLESISKIRKIDIRNYAIILIAARLGLRLSDILNIKLKDIDWQNNKINVIQPKTNNLNILPLTKEVGWSIIKYIQESRPKCNNEYLFVKHKYPFEKLEQFTEFSKYFEKANIDSINSNKKGIHNLRHSLATNMLNNEIPYHIIASTLGDSIETTTNTYLKVDKNKLKECGLELN